MKVIEKKCLTCGSPIYVYEECAREEMYCTLHCMANAASPKISRNNSSSSYLQGSDFAQNI